MSAPPRDLPGPDVMLPYSSAVLARFDAPAHGGRLAVTGRTFCGAAGSLGQGCQVQFELAMAAGRVVAVAFRAYGCPHTIAAAELVCERAEGLAPDAAAPDPHALVAALDAPLTKLGCMLVVQDAWAACMADLKSA